MVVAVVAVWVVQVTVDEVVHMVAMRDSFVATIGAVYVVAIMGAALVGGGAVGGIGGADFEGVFVDVVVVYVMEVTVVEVVDVSVMLNGGVSAAFAVYVIVRFVFVAAHFTSFLRVEHFNMY